MTVQPRFCTAISKVSTCLLFSYPRQRKRVSWSALTILFFYLSLFPLFRFPSRFLAVSGLPVLFLAPCVSLP